MTGHDRIRRPAGKRELADRTGAFDWAATPLGAMETWPHSLRTAADLMPAAPQPVYIGWGADLPAAPVPLRHGLCRHVPAAGRSRWAPRVGKPIHAELRLAPYALLQEPMVR